MYIAKLYLIHATHPSLGRACICNLLVCLLGSESQLKADPPSLAVKFMATIKSITVDMGYFRDSAAKISVILECSEE